MLINSFQICIPLLYQANWSESGEGIFHQECWSKLVKAAKGSSVGDTGSDLGDFQLNDLEKSLVLEAKKHAEFHDSMPDVKAEAARIAQMIKDSRYCIAFTGKAPTYENLCSWFGNNKGSDQSLQSDQHLCYSLI